MSSLQGVSGEKAFPYVSYRERFYPIIPIVIKGRERVVVYALVDSGATISLFHTSIAEDAGQTYLAGIGGYVRAHIKNR